MTRLPSHLFNLTLNSDHHYAEDGCARYDYYDAFVVCAPQRQRRMGDHRGLPGSTRTRHPRRPRTRVGRHIRRHMHIPRHGARLHTTRRRARQLQRKLTELT